MPVIDLAKYRANRRRVPRHNDPGPLRVHEPDEKDPAVPDAIWGMPKRMAAAAEKMGFNYQKDLVEASKVSQSVISRILNYKNLNGIEASSVAKIAIALKVPVDWLLLGVRIEVPRVEYSDGLLEDIESAHTASDTQQVATLDAEE